MNLAPFGRTWKILDTDFTDYTDFYFTNATAFMKWKYCLNDINLIHSHPCNLCSSVSQNGNSYTMNLWALLNLFEFFSLNNPYCVTGSTRFRWVKVPLDLMPLVDIQQVGGNASLAEAMEPGCHDRAVRYPRK